MKAVLRGIRITPKKANLVAGMVRGKSVKDALALLKFMPKKGAKIIYKVVQSAAANAKNNFGQSIDDLIVTNIWAVKGATLKRGTPANRGRIWPIAEIMSHITVEVGMPEGMTPSKPVAKASAKKASKIVEVSEAKATEKKPAKKAAAKKEPKIAA
ncbi:50S ribosomal protein L22 [Candidatus Peregrinibacteria bacterium]|nr:50S ribosomal protein L22 [Candidatus Peregrinibacteria bacterium]